MQIIRIYAKVEKPADYSAPIAVAELFAALRQHGATACVIVDLESLTVFDAQMPHAFAEKAELAMKGWIESTFLKGYYASSRSR